MLRVGVCFSGVFFVALIVCLVSGFGVAAQAPKSVDTPYAAPDDRALLVLARSRKRQASEVDVRVVSSSGRCLALLRNGWQAAAPIWPGTHMLMIVTGTTQPTVQLMQAKVSAGKTYVVRLRTRVNVKSPIDIQVVRRADRPLGQFPQDIKAVAPFEQDLRTCTEWVSWRRAKLEPKAESAKAKWDDAEEGIREGLTVQRDDGWTPDEVIGAPL